MSRFYERPVQLRHRTESREHARQLIDSPETHLKALVRLLETIIDPVSVALRNAPVDDEPQIEDEKREVAESRQWTRNNGDKGIPHEEALRRLRL